MLPIEPQKTGTEHYSGDVTRSNNQPAHPQVLDVNNSSWNVYEARSTKHGFDLLFGLPANEALQSLRRGSPNLISTPQLRAFWEANSAAKEEVLFDLPASRATLERVRQHLGFQPPQDFDKLFRSHVRELKTLTPEEFAKRHGITVRAAQRKRLGLFGRSTRPLNWWIKPDTLQVLTSGLHLTQISEKLGISATRARQLRTKACVLLNKPLDSPNARNYKPKDWWKVPETLQILTSGLTESQLSEKLGIACGYASHLRSKARVILNIPTPGTKRRIAKVRSKNWWQEPDVLQILTGGSSDTQIADKLGISATHASSLRAKACIVLNIPATKRPGERPLGWWQEPEPLQILTSEMTETEAAAKLGISTTHVRRLRGKVNVHLNQADAA